MIRWGAHALEIYLTSAGMHLQSVHGHGERRGKLEVNLTRVLGHLRRSRHWLGGISSKAVGWAAAIGGAASIGK